jgi:hypothetical protein
VRRSAASLYFAGSIAGPVAKLGRAAICGRRLQAAAISGQPQSWGHSTGFVNSAPRVRALSGRTQVYRMRTFRWSSAPLSFMALVATGDVAELRLQGLSASRRVGDGTYRKSLLPAVACLWSDLCRGHLRSCARSLAWGLVLGAVDPATRTPWALDRGDGPSL